MLISLLAGLLRWAWWSPLVVIAIGTLIDVFVFGPSRQDWKTRAGLEPVSDEAFFIGLGFGLVFSLLLNYALYGIGWGLRWVYDTHMRNRQRAN